MSRKPNMSPLVASAFKKKGFLFICSLTLLLIINMDGIDTLYRDFFSTKKYLLRILSDLNMEDIDQWCLPERKDKCTCPNPLVPTPRGWNGQAKNLELINSTLSSGKDIDVVLFGDSITEQWNGWWNGWSDSPAFSPVSEVFSELFCRDNGGKVEGLALGVVSDSSANLLWRVQNGELPENLNPKVFWVLIGINNFMHFQCSEELVVIGTRAIVEEIRRRKPHSKIVINGILPMEEYWSSIVSVNKQLEQLSGKLDNVEYFDASHLFLTNPQGVSTQETDQSTQQARNLIIHERMADGVHPTALGHRLFGEAIVERISEMISTDQSAPEELPPNE